MVALNLELVAFAGAARAALLFQLLQQAIERGGIVLEAADHRDGFAAPPFAVAHNPRGLLAGRWIA